MDCSSLLQFSLDKLPVGIKTMDVKDRIQLLTDSYVRARYWLDPDAVQRLEEILLAEQIEENRVLTHAFLALIYLEGYGIRRNVARARDLAQRFSLLLEEIILTKITSPIVPCAKFLLGKCLQALDADESKITGFDLIAESAQSMYTLAICELGDLYSLKTSKQDHPLAVKMYTQAIELGFQPALHKLGICYFKGEGVKQSYEKAYALFAQGAELGIINAINNVAECYFEGSGVEQNHTKAVTWYLQAAEKGDKSSQYSVAHYFRNSLGVGRNIPLAVYWCEKSANQDDVDAMFELATMLLFEDVEDPLYTERAIQGVSWINRILSTPNIDKENRTNSCRVLAKCLLNGLGIDADPIASLPWFTEALRNVEDLRLSKKDRIALFTVACQQNHREIMRYLIVHKPNCSAVSFKADPAALINYYSLAAEIGFDINNQEFFTNNLPLEYLLDLDLIIEFPSPAKASDALINGDVEKSLTFLRQFLQNGFPAPSYRVSKVRFTLTAEEWVEVQRSRADILHAIVHLEF